METLDQSLDVTTLVVMSNRLDSITREMTNTILRTARSTTMAARDFSCCIVTADHELISTPEGIPVHIHGMAPSARDMAELHPDFREGDAFLHNDPYLSGSHAADHQILVPVFFEGDHVFTAVVKAHQVDVGNSLPTTYMPMARDVYEEGALIFPCVRIQDGYKDVPDIIRMCERRIRGAEIWYGDYLAQLGATRLAERRLKDFCAKFGVPVVKQFVREYLEYSERVTADSIRRLPSGRVEGSITMDPFPGAPEGIPLKVTIDVDSDAGKVVVDLRDNPDCLPNGLNLTESTSRNAGLAGVLTVLNSTRSPDRIIVPNNSGSYRRIEVLLRENCVVGIPRHPASCSVATNTVADRVHGMISAAFARLGGSFGTAEPCFGSPPFMAVVSGHHRLRGKPYIMQIISGTAGGPGTAEGDGWLMMLLAAAGGVVYFDSAEVVEQKNPLVLWDRSVRVDSEGAGRNRGAPGNVCIYGPRFDVMEAHYFLEAVENPPQGVLGGGAAAAPEVWMVRKDGHWEQVLDQIGAGVTYPGEAIVSFSTGGGGYGDPLERDPAYVLDDVADEWLSIERARAAYGVVIKGDPARWETLEVDVDATAAERARRRGQTAPDEYRAPHKQQGWWVGANLQNLLDEDNEA